MFVFDSDGILSDNSNKIGFIEINNVIKDSEKIINQIDKYPETPPIRELIKFGKKIVFRFG